MYLLRLVTAVLAVALATTATAQPSTVILVRHAERAAEPAGDPVLTDAGMRRALDLKEVLRGARVTSVITTHLQRTQLTAKPLADVDGLSFIVVRAGGPTPAHVDSVAAAVRRRPAGDVVLVVGHSNTIPAIVGALGGPKLSDLCDTQYSMLYILEFSSSGPPRFIEAKYGAPDPPDSGTCARSMR
jgi:broad specificity phosphatase PhoE